MASRFRRLVAQIALVSVGAFGVLHTGLAAEDKGPAQSPVPATPSGRDGGVRSDSPMTSGRGNGSKDGGGGSDSPDSGGARGDLGT